MAERLHPFHQLIKPGTPFRWDAQLENLFQETKAVIVSEIEEGVNIFDQSKPTCFATDWSKNRNRILATSETLSVGEADAILLS